MPRVPVSRLSCRRGVCGAKKDVGDRNPIGVAVGGRRRVLLYEDSMTFES